MKHTNWLMSVVDAVAVLPFSLPLPQTHTPHPQTHAFTIKAFIFPVAENVGS